MLVQLMEAKVSYVKIEADTTEEATNTVKEAMSASMADWRIERVVESNYVDIVNL